MAMIWCFEKEGANTVSQKKGNLGRKPLLRREGEKERLRERESEIWRDSRG